jgi:hypothetical protein
VSGKKVLEEHSLFQIVFGLLVLKKRHSIKIVAFHTSFMEMFAANDWKPFQSCLRYIKLY